MYRSFCVFALVSSGLCRVLPEDSVVSVYTTQATTSNGYGLDVYHQIASNIAERLTSPFYRLFGARKNKTEAVVPPVRTETPGKLSSVDTRPTRLAYNDIVPVNTTRVRDVEELSEEAVTRSYTKKPEKISLLRYLPSMNEHLETNDTMNEVDSDLPELSLDDVESGRMEGPLIYLLELLGSLVQLIQGAFEAIFKPSSSSASPNTARI